MKRTKLFLSGIILSSMTLMADTVVEVNGKPIDAMQLLPLMQQMTQGRYAQLPDNAKKQVQQQALNQAIAQILIQEEAKRQNITKTKAYKKALSETLKKIEPKIASEVYLKSEFEKVPASEKDLKAFYNQHKDQFDVKERVHARHILVKTASEAESIINSLKKVSKSDLKRKFIELAKQKSTGPSGPNGGDLGSFEKGRMVPAFNDAVFKMKVNTITMKPVKTQFGYHVIYLESKENAVKKNFKQAHAEVEQQYKGQKFQEKLKTLMQKLKSKAKIVYK